MMNALTGKLIALQATSPLADGIFSTLKKGGTNLKAQWDTVAAFGGAIAIIMGIYYIVRAIGATQQKQQYWIKVCVAFICGGILLLTGGVNTIQGSFSDSWSEVFGTFIGLF